MMYQESRLPRAFPEKAVLICDSKHSPASLPPALLNKVLPCRLSPLPSSLSLLSPFPPSVPSGPATYLPSYIPFFQRSFVKSLESAKQRLTIRVIIEKLCTLICFINDSFCVLLRPWEHQQTGCGGNKRVVLRRQILSEAFGWTRGQVHEVISFYTQIARVTSICLPYVLIFS